MKIVLFSIGLVVCASLYAQEKSMLDLRSELIKKIKNPDNEFSDSYEALSAFVREAGEIESRSDQFNQQVLGPLQSLHQAHTKFELCIKRAECKKRYGNDLRLIPVNFFNSDEKRQLRQSGNQEQFKLNLCAKKINSYDADQLSDAFLEGHLDSLENCYEEKSLDFNIKRIEKLSLDVQSKLSKNCSSNR